MYIVRHGEAAGARADGERPLTAKGMQQAREAGSLLLPENPELLLFSPKLRTRQTASEILGVCQGADSAQANELVPPATLSDVAERLERVAELGVNSVVLVSHLPMVAELVAWLVDGDPNSHRLPGFPPAGVVALETDWFAAGVARPNWYAFPPALAREKF